MAGCAFAAVGFGVYKMMSQTRSYLEDKQRQKAPWERDPNAPV